MYMEQFVIYKQSSFLIILYCKMIQFFFIAGEFGVPLPWYFPVTKSYWCGSSQAGKHQDSQSYNFNHSYELNQNQESKCTNNVK